jgi:hypothetical protein
MTLSDHVAAFPEAVEQVGRYMNAHALPGAMELGVEEDYRLKAHEIMVVVDTEEQLKTWARVSEPFQFRLCRGIHDHGSALPISDAVNYVVVRQDGADGIIGGAPPNSIQPISMGWALWVRYYPQGRTVFARPPSNIDLVPGRGNSFTLSDRTGARPMTGSFVPHQQLTQQSPIEIRDALAEWMKTAFPHTRLGASKVSDSTTKALHLDGIPLGECARVLMPIPGFAEFGHLHEDGSMHLALSAEDRWELIVKEWGEQHPGARWGINAIMLFAPRDPAELEVAKAVFTAAYRYAIGKVK